MRKEIVREKVSTNPIISIESAGFKRISVDFSYFISTLIICTNPHTSTY